MATDAEPCCCVCRYAGGDSIKHTVFDNVDRATLKVYSSQENVAGVKIPKFESVSEPGETKMELTGVHRCTLHPSPTSRDQRLLSVAYSPSRRLLCLLGSAKRGQPRPRLLRPPL